MSELLELVSPFAQNLILGADGHVNQLLDVSLPHRDDVFDVGVEPIVWDTLLLAPTPTVLGN